MISADFWITLALIAAVLGFFLVNGLLAERGYRKDRDRELAEQRHASSTPAE